MVLIKTTKKHIQALVDISKAAFDSDINVGASTADGPPEYDSVDWHIEMMKQGHLFTAIEDDNIIGGAILFIDKNNDKLMYIGRIFIALELHRKGYGIKLMEQIEEMNPNISMWCLDTPIWNIRTNNFYKKLGYIETHRDEEMVYYKKIINR